MRLISVALLVSVAAAFPRAHALILEPMMDAAAELGFQIVSEIEFAKGSAQVVRTQAAETVHHAVEACPRVAAVGGLGETRVLLIAWPDREYPQPRARYASKHRELANNRAATVESLLRDRLPATLKFDVVNMSTRDPHRVRLPAATQLLTETFDVKAALELAGAAPTDAYEAGLFGEYAQRSKVMVWIDCSDPDVRPTPMTSARMKLARI